MIGQSRQTIIINNLYLIVLSYFRLCVVLFTKQGQHEKEKLILRLLAKDKKYQNEQRIQFLYLYEDVQKEFIINGFKDGMKEDTCADNSTAPKVKFTLILLNH